MISTEETLSVSRVVDQVVSVGEQRYWGQVLCVNQAPKET